MNEQWYTSPKVHVIWIFQIFIFSCVGICLLKVGTDRYYMPPSYYMSFSLICFKMHKATYGAPDFAEATLGFLNVFKGFQKSNKMVINHSFHCLTNTASR